MVTTLISWLHYNSHWVRETRFIKVLIVATILNIIRIRRLSIDRHCRVVLHSLLICLVRYPRRVCFRIRSVVVKLKDIVQGTLVNTSTSHDLLVLRVFSKTLIQFVVNRSTVIHILHTTRKGDIMLSRNWYACNSFIPISLISIVSTTSSHILFRREKFDTTSSISCANRTCVLYLSFTFFTFLSRNDDHTRVRTCTINSSSRTVLQHVHRLDVVRIDVVHTSARYTINDVERSCRTSQRTCTTDLHAKATVSRVTTTIFRHSQTSNFTLQKTFCAIERTFVKVFSLYARNRTGDLLLSL